MSEKPTITEEKYSRVAKFKVDGFWNVGAVRCYQTSGLTDDAIEWGKTEVSWSCGGRDPEEIACDIEAAWYFSEAIQDACRLAREWNARAGKVIQEDTTDE